jgi:hypothetical protein
MEDSADTYGTAGMTTTILNFLASLAADIMRSAIARPIGVFHQLQDVPHLRHKPIKFFTGPPVSVAVMLRAISDPVASET